MFTGIIEQLGTIKSIEKEGGKHSLYISGRVYTRIED